MMDHVIVVERWEDGNSTQLPPDAKVRSHSDGGKFDPFFTATITYKVGYSTLTTTLQP